MIVHFLFSFGQVAFVFSDEVADFGQSGQIDVLEGVFELLFESAGGFVYRDYFVLFVGEGLVHAMNAERFFILDAE